MLTSTRSNTQTHIHTHNHTQLHIQTHTVNIRSYVTYFSIVQSCKQGLTFPRVTHPLPSLFRRYPSHMIYDLWVTGWVDGWVDSAPRPFDLRAFISLTQCCSCCRISPLGWFWVKVIFRYFSVNWKYEPAECEGLRENFYMSVSIYGGVFGILFMIARMLLLLLMLF